MGKRGPKPNAELKIVKFKGKDNKPNPPAGMTARARNLFRKLVAENKPDAFDSESVVLLAAFCEAESNHYDATKHIQKEGQVVTMFVGWNKTTNEPISKPVRNPWFNIQKEAVTSMTSISAKLRAKRLEIGIEKRPVYDSGRKGLMFGE